MKFQISTNIIPNAPAGNKDIIVDFTHVNRIHPLWVGASPENNVNATSAAGLELARSRLFPSPGKQLCEPINMTQTHLVYRTAFHVAPHIRAAHPSVAVRCYSSSIWGIDLHQYSIILALCTARNGGVPSGGFMIVVHVIRPWSPNNMCILTKLDFIWNL